MNPRSQTLQEATTLEAGSGPESAELTSSDGFVRLTGDSRRFEEIVAVQDLSLSLRRGEFFSLLGPSGCGKTTTLRMIAGFEQPSSGKIEIMGRDVVNLPPNRRPVNTVFQSYALFSHLNVYDNVAFGLREKRKPRSEIRATVTDALLLVQLSGYGNRKPRELSGGEQQRVALARAIVNEPAVLLLDEPLGALDLKLRHAMQVELKALQQRLEMTFLYVTHDQEEALTMSNRVGVMEKGRIVQVGTPQEIYDRPVNAYVASFVGDVNMLAATVLGSDDDALLLTIGGRLVRALGRRFEAGRLVKLVVRPERVDIARADVAGGDDPSGLPGVVEETFFVGSHRKVVVSAVGTRVVASTPHRGDAVVVEPGDEVRLSWREEDAWVIEGGAHESRTG